MCMLRMLAIHAAFAACVAVGSGWTAGGQRSEAVSHLMFLLANATWSPPPDNRCILCAGARLPLAPCEISAIQKQSALANGQFRIRIRGRFDSPLSRRLRANYTGIGHLRSTPASSCCSATSCTILRPFSHPSIVQTGGVVLEERPSTLSIWPTSAVQC